MALRFLGLAGKVVIIDEVHAYDAYMSVILARVLAWLGAARVPVILLSATLPAGARQELMAAYAGGPVTAADPCYPLLTWVDAPAPEEGAGQVAEWELPAESLPAAAARRRRPPASRAGAVRLRQLAERDEATGAGLAARAVADGGCVLVIRNTAGRAQQTYRQLQGLLGASGVTLAHARFTAADRRGRDRRLTGWFGPPGQASRPGRHVVVATQVAESRWISTSTCSSATSPRSTCSCSGQAASTATSGPAPRP